MTKIFVLDTNVLMYEPNSIFTFEDNEVVIPLVVLDELDKKKDGTNQASRHARMVIRMLDEMRYLGNLHEGVPTESGGKIRVELNCKNNVPESLDPIRIDNQIISVAIGLSKSGQDVKVISKDLNLRVKCDALKVKAEDYTSDFVVDSLDEVYKGHRKLEVSSEDIDAVCGGKSINPVIGLNINEYLHLVSNSNPQHGTLARFNGTEIEKIKYYNNVWGISPKNREQKYVLDALFNPDIKIVTISGIAGTGKTLCSLVAGVSQILDHNVYKKMSITRPTQPLGKELGYLPGSLEEKMSPWMTPIMDNLELIFSDKGKNYIEQLRDSGLIEIEPLTYIRGRSLNSSFMVLDETQNLSRHEIKTLITRAGFNTKVVLGGDIEQIDTPYLDYSDNGLSYVIEKFKNSKISAHIMLTKGERSDLATLAADRL